MVQARRFCWEETADKTLDVLTRPHVPEPTVHPRRRDARRVARIAFFSPLPPLRSGVSDYSARLLDELKRSYSIDLYHDAGYLPHIGLRSPDFGCFDYRLFERNARVLGYHALVYQMGNSHYHGYMYETLLRHPGIVTLHDLGIADFHFWYAQQPGVDGDAHVRSRVRGVLRGCGPTRSSARSSPAPMHRGRCRRPASSRVITSMAGSSSGRPPWSCTRPGASSRCAAGSRAHLGKMSVVPFGATALDPSPDRAMRRSAPASRCRRRP